MILICWQLLKIQKNTPNLDFGYEKGCKSRNYLIYTLCCGEGGIDFVHPLRCRGHPCKKKKQTNLQINLSFCLLFFLRRERLQNLWNHRKSQNFNSL